MLSPSDQAAQSSGSPEERASIAPAATRARRRGCAFYASLLLLFALLFVFGFPFLHSLLFGGMPLVGEAIAIVRVESLVLDGEPIVEEIKKHAANSQIRGIVLRIDSPGGAVGAAQEIYDAVLLARETKPIFASMGNAAASGGYYIAAAANEIFANPGTLTGSIGVIMELANWRELVDKVGLQFEVVKSGQHKDIGSPNRDMTPEERRLLQGVIDDTHQQFLEAILAVRQPALGKAMTRHPPRPPLARAGDSPSTDSVKAYLSGLADGRIFSGRQAHSYGLVDHLGGLEAAVQAMGLAVGLADPQTYEIPRKKTLAEMLFARIGVPLPGESGRAARLLYRAPIQ